MSEMTEIFFEIFDNLPRQGPGSEEATKKAISIINPGNANFEILDIGCGTGAQTLVLAENLNGQITATDTYQPYLDLLSEKADREGLAAKILCQNMDMAKLNFDMNRFDLIWAEGSIYIIGFANGLQKIKPFLKPGGYAVFSDMNWFRPDPPEELGKFFENECPFMVSVEKNKKMILENGYELIGSFQLSENDFLDPYYNPLESRLIQLRKKYPDNEEAAAVIEEVQLEIDLYRKYHAYYGYTFYIMKNIK